MHDDEVTEVRRVRHEISAECGHDVRKVAAYYRSVENELKQSGEFRFEESSLALEARRSATDAESAE